MKREYLECNDCKRTFDGIPRRIGESLRRAASRKGWFHSPPDRDYCATCTARRVTGATKARKP
jgi:ribosomal protein L34E